MNVMSMRLVDIENDKPDKVLNGLSGTVAFAASMGFLPLIVIGVVRRFPGLPLRVLYGVPTVLLLLFLVWIQFRWPRKKRAAGQAAVFGFLLNCAFWFVLAYGAASSD